MGVEHPQAGQRAGRLDQDAEVPALLANPGGRQVERPGHIFAAANDLRVRAGRHTRAGQGDEPEQESPAHLIRRAAGGIS